MGRRKVFLRIAKERAPREQEKTRHSGLFDLADLHRAIDVATAPRWSLVHVWWGEPGWSEYNIVCPMCKYHMEFTMDMYDSIPAECPHCGVKMGVPLDEQGEVE